MLWSLPPRRGGGRAGAGRDSNFDEDLEEVWAQGGGSSLCVGGTEATWGCVGICV